MRMRVEIVPICRFSLLQAAPLWCTMRTIEVNAMRAKQVPTEPSFTENTPREELIHRIRAYIELLPTSELLPLAKSLQKSVAPLFENDGTCPHCGSENTVKNGWRHGKQAYICRDCKKTFVSTTGTIRHRSHQTTDVWMDAIVDTKNGLSLQKSSDRIGLCKEAIMEMRHKIRNTMDQDGSLTKPKKSVSAKSTDPQTESETNPTEETET